MSDQNQSSATDSQEFPNWPKTAERPQYPTVRLFFGGLLDFFYKTGECEIGVNPGDGRHRLLLEVTDVSTKKTIFTTNDLPPNPHEVTFAIENKQPAVNFLKIGPYVFDRSNGDEHDSRWMLDLEGDHSYSA